MRLNDYLSSAALNIRRSFLRAALTVIGIAIGIAASHHLCPGKRRVPGFGDQFGRAFFQRRATSQQGHTAQRQRAGHQLEFCHHPSPAPGAAS